MNVQLLRMSDVEPIQLAWLWADRFPLGKLSLLLGDPSLGKSLITTDMAARVSRGTPLPDCRDMPNPAGSVLMMSAEDDVADTIVPRLMAAGADLSRIHTITTIKQPDGKLSAFSLAEIPALAAAVQQIGDVRLIVIDPVSAYMAGTDSHKNAEVRSLLSPLADLAQRQRAAVVCVTHLTKAYGGRAMYRAMGSLAFVAAARAAWAVVMDPNNPRHRGLLPVKMNVGHELTGLGYYIERMPVEGVDHQPVIAWEAAPLDQNADDWLAAEVKKAAGGSDRDTAADWLRELLANGPVRSADVQAAAKSAGMSWATVRRAKDDLGVTPRKRGFSDAAWYWALQSTEDAQMAEDAQHNPLSAFGDGEHLRATDAADLAMLADQTERGLR